MSTRESYGSFKVFSRHTNMKNSDKHLKHDKCLTPLINTLVLDELPSKTSMLFELIRYTLIREVSKNASKGQPPFEVHFEDLTPQRILRMSSEDFKMKGVSRSAASHVRSIAIHYDAHTDFWSNLERHDSELILRRLSQIKGVHPVDVQKMLLFGLKRPDIFPDKDPELKAAVIRLYQLDPKQADLEQQIAAISDGWRPYRSRACRYLWLWWGKQKK